MTRLYIQPSFLNSCEEHGLWSGGNDQYRGDRSVDLSTFDKNGRARVEAFSDEALDSLKKRKTSIPIADRILPQKRRLDKLNDEIRELESAYRSGEISLNDYSILRDVAFSKRDRAEVLYKKAISVRPIRSETDEDSAQVQAEYTPSSGFSAQDDDGYGLEEYEEIGVRFIDELSETNSLKSFLKFSCKAIRKAVQFSQATRNYVKTLSEV